MNLAHHAPALALLAALTACAALLLREGHRDRARPGHGQQRPHSARVGTDRQDRDAIKEHDMPAQAPQCRWLIDGLPECDFAPDCPDHGTNSAYADHHPDAKTLTAADVSLVAADCPYGAGPGDGSGCIKPSGHHGDHIVTPGVSATEEPTR